MVTYGAGDSKLDHTDEENVNLDEYLDSIRILQKGLHKTFIFIRKLKNLVIKFVLIQELNVVT